MDDAKVIAICCVCDRVRKQAKVAGPREQWGTLDEYLKSHHISPGDYRLTHTYCPSCARQFKKLYKSQTDRQVSRRQPAASHSHSDAADAVLDVFSSVQRCDLDMLVRACPTLTWNQVFSEVDRLSRIGKLRLSYLGRGRYSIELARHADRPLVAQT